MNASQTEIIVVGGGVIGCSIAWHLSRLGVHVTLLEQRGIASAASGASAGGVRQQGRDLRELPLAIRAIQRWERLEEELDADLHYYREGHLQVVEREEDLPQVERSVEAQREVGLDLRIVAGADLRELAPGVANSVVAGTYSANDGHANPILTTHAFADAARREGATIRTGSPVTAIHVDGGRVPGVETPDGRLACDHLVMAAGLWSPLLASQLGITLPIEPFAPQMIATAPMPLRLRQVLGAVSRKLSLKQISTGNYVIGGGWPGDVELDAGVATPRQESILGSIRDASAVFPELVNATVERVWVGVEALAVDEIPILGPLPDIDNLTVATGFSGHGFALSPVVGELIAELVTGRPTSLPIDAFSPNRFEEMGAGVSYPTGRAG